MSFVKNIILLLSLLISSNSILATGFLDDLIGGLYKNEIKVGILHSLTGTMAISEKPVVDATLMAIKEINAKGGLLGRKINAIVIDGQSDNQQFAREVERLITEEKVDVIFGCWTSACRKTIKPIVEKHQHLFFYPIQYEGLEQSEHIIYTGATPNQQIIPTIKWAVDNLGRRFFLVSSDYVFPRAANQIIHDVLPQLSAQVVGEQYIPLGSQQVQTMIAEIVKAQPDVIINTINGDSNLAFFKQLNLAGIDAEKIPVISFSIGESELQSLDIELIEGHYSSWNYFQSIDSQVNQQFVKKYQQMYGLDRVTSDPIESAYFSVYLWAQAVRFAKKIEPLAVLSAIKGQGFMAPEGMVTIDSTNLHTWKTVRIGKINKQGKFSIVWDSVYPVKPQPYPSTRSKHQWDAYLLTLYDSYGGQWQAESANKSTFGDQ